VPDAIKKHAGAARQGGATLQRAHRVSGTRSTSGLLSSSSSCARARREHPKVAQTRATGFQRPCAAVRWSARASHTRRARRVRVCAQHARTSANLTSTWLSAAVTVRCTEAGSQPPTKPSLLLRGRALRGQALRAATPRQAAGATARRAGTHTPCTSHFVPARHAMAMAPHTHTHTHTDGRRSEWWGFVVCSRAAARAGGVSSSSSLLARLPACKSSSTDCWQRCAGRRGRAQQ
jgi:hypothetical protein